MSDISRDLWWSTRCPGNTLVCVRIGQKESSIELKNRIGRQGVETLVHAVAETLLNGGAIKENSHPIYLGPIKDRIIKMSFLERNGHSKLVVLMEEAED